MHDQPRSPTCRCFLRPHADQIRRRITKKAGKLRDTDVIRCSLELDERVIAAERNVRALEGFTHEEWTDGGGSAREGNEIVASQSLTTLVYQQSYRVC